jgi:hypothetical protein
LYDKKNNRLVTRMQPGHDNDAVFCGHTQEEINLLATWLPIESADMTKHLLGMEEKGEQPVAFYGGWMLRENQPAYWNVAYFIPPGLPKDHVTLGVVAFDEDYLRTTFLPVMM